MSPLVERVAFGFWAAFALFMAILSWRLGLHTFSAPGPGMMPFLAAVILLVVSLWQLVRSSATATGDAAGTAEPSTAVAWGRMLALVVLLVVYALVLEMVGFVVTTFVWLVFLFELTGPRRLVTSVLGALLTVGVCWVVFVVLLKLQFPRGVLGI